MSTTPPRPGERARASFIGGVRRWPLGWGISAPFGHLEFDASELRIWGGGAELHVRRDEIQGIRLSRGIFATRVSVIKADGAAAEVYFAALGRRGVRAALQARGWLVFEHGRPESTAP